MQDWNYLRTNCFELTFELTCVKFPNETQLRSLWEENKYPLMYFIKQIHRYFRRMRNWLDKTVVEKVASCSSLPGHRLCL